MKTINFSEKEFTNLIETMKEFTEIYGDDETPFEIEDYISLVDLGRSMIWQFESRINDNKL